MIRRRRFLSLVGPALATLGALAAGGCGGAQAHDPRASLPKFPGLGYRAYPPHLPPGLAKGAVVVVDMTNTGRVRPAGLRFASDGTLSAARWSTWGAGTATAHGTATVQICTTSCGAGHPVRYPATMVLTGIRTCGQTRYYEQARVTLMTVRGPRRWGAFLRVPCA